MPERRARECLRPPESVSVENGQCGKLRLAAPGDGNRKGRVERSGG
jgi:hypothetical protein